MNKAISSWILVLIVALAFTYLLIPNWNSRKLIVHDTTKREDIPKISSETLVESSSMILSSDKYWWLNSGAYAEFKDNIIFTIQGELNETDIWRIKYQQYNSSETDNGYHPQNIFRLVTRDSYKNIEQSMKIKINRYILSDDEHRSESNGILFFNHYQDGDNLYYVGIRVDGYGVIKKKYKGQYSTLAYNRIFDGEYNRKTNPNLIPTNRWIGIRSEVFSDSDGVILKLYVDIDDSGNWVEISKYKDESKLAIIQPGYAGIRSDFMDAEFMNYQVVPSKTISEL